MKKIFNISILLMAMSASISAQSETNRWLPISSGMFFISSTENEKIFLVAAIDVRTNDVGFQIFDATEVLCKEGVSSDPSAYPPIEINGKYVQILSTCLNGLRITAPTTAEGRSYFKGQIESGSLITVVTDMGPPLKFNGIPPANLRAKLLEAKNAM